MGFVTMFMNKAKNNRTIVQPTIKSIILFLLKRKYKKNAYNIGENCLKYMKTLFRMMELPNNREDNTPINHKEYNISKYEDL